MKKLKFEGASRVMLGVSLYPGRESIAEIESYLKMAAGYGFTRVFTSLFNCQGTTEDLIAYFKPLTEIAHRYGMKVSGDCNVGFLEKYGASEKDLSLFHKMGIDILRMDFCFCDARDAELVNNDQGIEIEMSTIFPDAVEQAVKSGADPKRIIAVHNFYPQRYTGDSSENVNRLHKFCKTLGVGNGVFISSTRPGTHGPWPVSDGLPTMEIDRDLPIEVQLKHCLALENVVEIYIGNAFAEEREFQAIAALMENVYREVPKLTGLHPSLAFLADYVPHGTVKRIPFEIELVDGLSPVEKDIVFNYPAHSISEDSMDYMLRSRWSRMVYGNQSIPCRKTNKSFYQRGDVVLVNDNLQHYRGELQIVMRDMRVDGQRNLIGRISENERFILDYMKADDIFTFLPTK